VHKDLKFRAFKTAFENARFSTDLLHRVAPFFPQRREVKAAHMAQLDTCEMCPQPLTRIQFWSIGREALEVNPLRGPMREALLDDVTAMHRCPIPHDPQAARHLPPQMLQKGHDICRVDRPALAVNRQLAVGGNGAHGREMIASPPLLENRRVAHRGIGADHTGQGRESGRIDEEEALPVGLRPLLMAGQVSWRQRAMLASSRWRARRAGFWRLQRSVLSKRPTGLGR
jgi:hypothetical protein